MVASQVKLSKFSFVDTTATQKIFALTKRIRAVAGGTSASKTISILVWLIDYCQSNKNKLATVVSESYPHLEKGAMLDFENIMRDRGYWDDNRWNMTKHQYRFETGSILEFYSPNTYGKAHGPRRDVLFVNEANHMRYATVDQLMVRTREIVWMDWNPTNEFWFYTEILNVRDPQDVDFITLTYKDNEALDPVTVREIESHKDNKSWWPVYGLGQLGDVEGKIYVGWKIRREVPHEAELIRYGLDFGYSDDPAVLVALYKYNGGFIVNEEFYQKGMGNKQIADTLLNLPKGLVIADSSEPKSIDEIKSYGVNILPCQKGPDSVRNGISTVQHERVTMTAQSLHTIKEYRNYLWIIDKDGRQLPEPNPGVEGDHAMDAIRYAITSVIKPPKKGAYVWRPPRNTQRR